MGHRPLLYHGPWMGASKDHITRAHGKYKDTFLVYGTCFELYFNYRDSYQRGWTPKPFTGIPSVLLETYKDLRAGYAPWCQSDVNLTWSDKGYIQ